MLKFRLRPNRYVMAKNYVQVVSTNKEYRDIALDWLTSNVEGQPVKARATLTLPDGAEVDATAFYGQNTPILKGKLEVSEPKFLGVIFGTIGVLNTLWCAHKQGAEIHHIFDSLYEFTCPECGRRLLLASDEICVGKEII